MGSSAGADRPALNRSSVGRRTRASGSGVIDGRTPASRWPGHRYGRRSLPTEELWSPRSRGRCPAESGARVGDRAGAPGTDNHSVAAPEERHACYRSCLWRELQNRAGRGGRSSSRLGTLRDVRKGHCAGDLGLPQRRPVTISTTARCGGRPRSLARRRQWAVSHIGCSHVFLTQGLHEQCDRVRGHTRHHECGRGFEPDARFPLSEPKRQPGRRDLRRRHGTKRADDGEMPLEPPRPPPPC